MFYKSKRHSRQVILMFCLFYLMSFGEILAAPFFKATSIFSPDMELELKINYHQNSGLQYTFERKGLKLISPSQLGISLGEITSIPSNSWSISKIIKDHKEQIWAPVWEKSDKIKDDYNEALIEFKEKGQSKSKIFQVIIRVYNDGFAFRYEIPKGSSIVSAGKNSKDLTSFNFSEDYHAWYYNGENDVIGPVRLSQFSGDHQPAMTLKVNDSCYLALLEADLRTGDPIKLYNRPNSVLFSINSSLGVLKPGFKSSWRVVLYGKMPGSLVDSHVVQLLNPAPEAGRNFSWVKPGLSVWDWRIRGAIVENFIYDANLSSWERLINFANKYEIPYLLIDAGWYGPEYDKKSNPIKNEKIEDIKKAIHYGQTKGVRIILYVNDIALIEYGIESTLKEFSLWGASGVKVGFMQGKMAHKNERTRFITSLCAEYHLLCNFHDYPVIPYGQIRTYPNAVTREFGHSQLDAGRFFTPDAFLKAVYVNMLAGPIDMDNGIFNLLNMKSENVYGTTVPSTVVSEAARTLTVFSGLTVLPDIPENYEKFPQLLDFITHQKMPWRRSRTVMGEIGKYIVMARKSNSNVWLIGAVTDTTSRILEIPLDFLDGDDNYTATIIQDGDDANYLTNRTSYKTEKRIVNSSTIIKVSLVKGGGACITLEKLSETKSPF